MLTASVSLRCHGSSHSIACYRPEKAMPLTLNRIGQIALAVRDVDKAEAFYRDVLRLRWLYRFGDLTFFDCSGVRLLL